ncbi:hypothetical protein [Streptomyces sp. NPDC086989]|uniref:hypothetical protein n=1 Tax=Streptomyces sp. NPDC086989 TaxID=3365764 RepID=UPI00381B64E7
MPSKKNVPTIGRPSKCAAWGVSGGAAAIELGADGVLIGPVPRAASMGLAWAIRSAVQYCSSVVEAGDASSGVGVDAEGEGGAVTGGGVGRGSCEAEGVEPERDNSEGLGVGGDDEDEAEGEGRVSAGEGAADAARAVGAVSSTVLVPSASAVNHFDLNDLLSECSDDTWHRSVLVRQFDEEGRVGSGVRDRQRIQIGDK